MGLSLHAALEIRGSHMPDIKNGRRIPSFEMVMKRIDLAAQEALEWQWLPLKHHLACRIWKRENGQNWTNLLYHRRGYRHYRLSYNTPFTCEGEAMR
jgi:hypothetical protein